MPPSYRVYRGSLRGTTVAVKVVEHSAAGSSRGDPAAEALLLCALAHPNIVSLLKTVTIRLQAAALGEPSGGGSSWAASPSPQPTPAAHQALGSPFGMPAGPPIEQRGSQVLAAPGGYTAPSSSEALPASGGDSRDMSTVNQVALEAAAIATAVRLSGGRPAAVPLTAAPKDIAGSSGSVERAGGAVAGGLSSPSAVGSSALASSRASVQVAGPAQYETWLVLEYCERGSLEDAIRKKLLWRPDGSRRLVGCLTRVALRRTWLQACKAPAAASRRACCWAFWWMWLRGCATFMKRVGAQLDVQPLLLLSPYRLPCCQVSWMHCAAIVMSASYHTRAGVVHGDLKPGNVLLKSAGRGTLVAKLAGKPRQQGVMPRSGIPHADTSVGLSI